MAKAKKTQRQIRDDAYLASQQIDLVTQAIPSINTFTPPRVGGVPDKCPACLAQMKLASGWTALSATTAGHGVLQCGFCGHSISVTTQAFEEFRAATKALADERAARIQERKAKPRTERRTRGAG